MTKNGTDPLLSEEENTAELVVPTDAEMKNAITSTMTNLLTVVCLPNRCGSLPTDQLQVKAVQKFKGLLAHHRTPAMTSILGEGEDSRFFQPPLALQRGAPALPPLGHKSRSLETFDRQATEGALAAKGIHREIDLSRPGAGQFKSKRKQLDDAIDPIMEDSGEHRGDGRRPKITGTPPTLSTEHGDESPNTLSRRSTALETPTDDPEKFPPFRRMHTQTADDIGRRGHAHDPLEDHLYLFVGPSTFSGPSGNADRRPSFVPEEDDVPIVSESPGAADIDIYETAYRDEIERIRSRARTEDSEPTVYLTRRVDAKLLALSGQAGRLMAMGEEGFERFNEVTNFRERKAKVTEVSRALKAAAKEEYLKRKHEMKQELERAKAENLAAKKAQPTPPEEQGNRPDGDTYKRDSPAGGDAETAGFFRKPFAGKGSEAAKQTKNSFLGLMNAMKEKAKDSRAE